MRTAATFEDIKSAYEKIKPIIRKTPIKESKNCSSWVGTETLLKFENNQLTGSFKIRGAYNKISGLTEEEKARGLIACSAGNHAQGVAYSAKLLNVKSTIVMPELAPVSKVEATKKYGADVILHGNIFDEAFEYAQKLRDQKNYVFIHPYDDEQIIAGQGSLGLEIFEQAPDLDSVVIPIGGGGLISGVALALKTLNPKIKVYGAVAQNAPGVSWLFDIKNGINRNMDNLRIHPTIADGIGIKSPNKYIFDTYLSKHIDGVITVSEDEIAESIVYLLERAKTLVEGSGAIGLGAAKKAKEQGLWDLGKKTCILLCGGNIDLNLIGMIINRGLIRSGRLARIEVLINDMPGNLNALTTAIALCGANVIDVTHNRLGPLTQVRETEIRFLLETSNDAHIRRVVDELSKLPIKNIKVNQ